MDEFSLAAQEKLAAIKKKKKAEVEMYCSLCHRFMRIAETKEERYDPRSFPCEDCDGVRMIQYDRSEVVERHREQSRNIPASAACRLCGNPNTHCECPKCTQCGRIECSPRCGAEEYGPGRRPGESLQRVRDRITRTARRRTQRLAREAEAAEAGRHTLPTRAVGTQGVNADFEYTDDLDDPQGLLEEDPPDPLDDEDE